MLTTKGCTIFQNVGKLLEYGIHKALTHLKLEHSHNPFDNHFADRMGRGVDIVGETFEVEAKNVNGKYGLSPYWCKREIDNRFGDNDKRKVVVLSYNNLSVKQRDYYRNLGWTIVELGFQVTKGNVKEAISMLIRKLYFLVAKQSYSTSSTKPMSNVLEKSSGLFGGGYGGCLVNTNANTRLHTQKKPEIRGFGVLGWFYGLFGCGEYGC